MCVFLPTVIRARNSIAPRTKNDSAALLHPPPPLVLDPAPGGLGRHLRDQAAEVKVWRIQGEADRGARFLFFYDLHFMQKAPPPLPVGCRTEYLSYTERTW